MAPFILFVTGNTGGSYRVVRWLDKETFFYTTVFALSSEHADILTPIAEEKQPAAMFVRVVHRPPKVRDWPGFYFYGSEKLAFEFGFVTEQVVVDVRQLRAPHLLVAPPADEGVSKS